MFLNVQIFKYSTKCLNKSQSANERVFPLEPSWVPLCFIVIIHVSTPLVHNVRILQQVSGI